VRGCVHQVTELPVRTSKFVVRKQWIVCGADDMFIRVYNYNTSEQVKVFEAHTDYIRCIAVHPSLPCVSALPSFSSFCSERARRQQ
jgi:coatomer subunit beta'